jgi:exodeoxyribonuclease-5
LQIDLGYVLTVHSSQGSEWPIVCVFDEYNRRDDRNRWAYTAATRAQDYLIWCHR